MLLKEVANKTIGINIWDDYGEVLETYAYVESAYSDDFDLTNNDCKTILTSLKSHIEDNIKLSPMPSLKIDYNHGRWNLMMKPLPHDNREKLVKELGSWDYHYDSMPTDVYSES